MLIEWWDKLSLLTPMCYKHIYIKYSIVLVFNKLTTVQVDSLN